MRLREREGERESEKEIQVKKKRIDRKMFDVVTNKVLTEEQFSITNEDTINRIDKRKVFFSLFFVLNFTRKKQYEFIYLFIHEIELRTYRLMLQHCWH